MTTFRLDRCRRDFLRGCGAMGTVGLASAMSNLTLINAASAACMPEPGNDYKALVCVFLFGGNDSTNLFVPTAAAPYNDYAAQRGNLALARADLLAHPIAPANYSDPFNGSDFGMHPNLADEFDGNAVVNLPGGAGSGFRGLFNEGKAALLAGVGTLVEPIADRTAFYSSATPPELFSHNSQQFQWQTGRPDSALKRGWGGRLADLVYCLNESSAFSTSISLAGFNTFQIGDAIAQYSLQPDGTPAGLEGPEFLTDLARELLPGQRNWLGQGYAEIKTRALSNFDQLASVIGNAPEVPGTERYPRSSLGQQLRAVARMISVRNDLAVPLRRQIFFCAAGGWDTHAGQNEQHPRLIGDVSQAMTAFQRSMEQLGLADSVTAFTASDFGRTFTSNGKGSDHGWAGNQLIVGGAVNGGEIYGALPQLSLASELNIDDNRGSFIPTTSIEQYAAVLAHWFGVPVANLADALPTLGRFDMPIGNPALDFMS